MKKQHLPNRTFLTNFAMQTILLIFLVVSNIFSQVVITERIEINPTVQKTNTRTTEGDGWWIDTCYINTYDSTEVDLTFTPSAIEPGETTIMTVDYDEDQHYFLERNIILEPNIGTLVRLDSTYKYYAPTSTPGDTALIVRIYYEQFWWYCASGALKADTSKTNNTLEDYICGCPIGQIWTQVNRRYGIDSIMIAWDSLDVKVEPDTIYPGDTAQVVIKKRLPDGTLTDFDSTQTYEAGMLDGCVFGKIVAGAQEGPYVVDVLQPIYFIADTSADTTGSVLLRVGLVESTNKSTNKNNEQTDFVESDCFIGGQFGSYDEVNIYVPDPLIIRYPTPETIEWITDEPQMPYVACWAEYCRNFSSVIKYEWKYIVRKFYARRGGATCIRISKSEFHGVSYSLGAGLTVWDVPFNKDSGYFYFKSLQPWNNRNDPLDSIYGCDGQTNTWYDTNTEIFTGGEVMITLIAKNYQTGDILARLDTVHLGKILGLNPEQSTVETYANSNKIKAIIWKETDGTFKHFTGQGVPIKYWWPYNEEGWPLYGGPNGFGLTQLDCDPAAKERQLWNWEANIDGGKERLAKAYEGVYEHHGAPNEEMYNLTNAFHDYNHGNNSKYYVWTKRKWDLNPDREDEYGNEVYTKYIQYGGGD